MARSNGEDTTLSRRAFVGKLAAGAVAAGTVATIAGRASARTTGAAGTAAASAAPSGAASATEAVATTAEVASAPAPWELLRPLTAGAPLAHGWTVAELSPVEAGSCVVTLRNAQGTPRRVHLCRNGGTPAGLVYTERYDLVVMNGGTGELPTDEGLAQAVAALAHAVAGNERAHAEPGPLLAHAERVERFASSAKLR